MASRLSSLVEDLDAGGKGTDISKRRGHPAMSLPTQSAPKADHEPKDPGRFEGAVRHAPASRSLEAPLTAGSCCAASHCLPPARIVTPAQASGKRSHAGRAGGMGSSHPGAAAAT